MPIAQREMTPEQCAAVLATLAHRMEIVGTPRYDSEGDDWGLTPPITPASLRTSRSGAPWACYGTTCYRLADTETATCVLDDDGRPLGVADEGLLVLVRLDCGGQWVAVIVNTGYNRNDEIIWA